MAFFVSDWLDNNDDIGHLSHWKEDSDSMKDYEFSILHRSDDEHDSMKEYEFSINRHND